MEWVGSFAYAGDIDTLMVDGSMTHYELIEEIEDLHNIVFNRNWAFGWLYTDGIRMGVQWSSVEYYTGDIAARKAAEKAIEREYRKPVIEVEGLSQWDDGMTFAKVADDVENRARGSWPSGYSWATSWLYLPNEDEVLISENEHQGHSEVIEEYEDETGQEINLDQPYQVGLLLIKHGQTLGTPPEGYVIYPEYSDWDRGNRRRIPVSDNEVLWKVKSTAEAKGWEPIIGFLRNDDYMDHDDAGMVQTFSRFNPKKPRRHHIKKHELQNFHEYHGMGLFICADQPPAGGAYSAYGKTAAIAVNIIDVPDRGIPPLRRSYPLIFVPVQQKLYISNRIGYHYELVEAAHLDDGDIRMIRGTIDDNGNLWLARNDRTLYSEVAQALRQAGYKVGDRQSKVADEQLQLPTLIKFVSLPDKFLVGEDTHHVYLLEAEYGIGEFPHDTGAIGRAWLEDNTITGIGFDYGTASAQQLAISQLTNWAHTEGYEVSPDLDHEIKGLASIA